MFTVVSTIAVVLLFALSWRAGRATVPLAAAFGCVVLGAELRRLPDWEDLTATRWVGWVQAVAACSVAWKYCTRHFDLTGRTFSYLERLGMFSTAIGVWWTPACLPLYLVFLTRHHRLIPPCLHEALPV
jgi:hypothetical protein